MAFKWYPSVSNDWHWKTENSFEVEGHYCQLFELRHTCRLHWPCLRITSQDIQIKTTPTELALKNPIQIPLLAVSCAWLIFYFLGFTHLPLELGHTDFLSAAKRPPFLGSSALARLLDRGLSSHLSGMRSNVTSTVCGYLNDLTPTHPTSLSHFFPSCLTGSHEQFISWLYICLLWLVLPTLHSGHVGFWKEKNLWALFAPSFPALWAHPV